MASSIPEALVFFRTATKKFIKNTTIEDASLVASSAKSLNKALSTTELPDELKSELAKLDGEPKEKLQNEFEFTANYSLAEAFKNRINLDRNKRKEAIDLEAETKLKQAAEHVPVIAEAQAKLRKIAQELAAPLAV